MKEGRVLRVDPFYQNGFEFGSFIYLFIYFSFFNITVKNCSYHFHIEIIVNYLKRFLTRE